MSHILHFYHLVALDYVNPYLTRPFLAPRYSNHHYITHERVLALAGLLGMDHPAVQTIVNVLPGDDLGIKVNNYLVGQYLRALDMRRICHEIGAIFAGREPICSGYSPGGVTTSVKTADVNQAITLLNKVKAFIGSPTDFATGTPKTMMFDAVAAAHLFYEYFWIGNSWGHFMANGLYEGGFVNGVSDFTAHFIGRTGIANNPDKRGFRRGYRLSAQNPFPGGGGYTPPSALKILKIGESIANSRYDKDEGGNYPGGAPFMHPWDGETSPNTSNEYSWLKSPRYDVSGTTEPNYQVFEVGPLARQVVQGNYFAGVLNALGYTLTPTWNAYGPDISSSSYPLYGAGIYPNGGPNLSSNQYIGDSTLDRIAARAFETYLMGRMLSTYLTQLKSSYMVSGYSKNGCTDSDPSEITSETKGYGMTEASRGALSHWIRAENGKIKKYQAIVPTTWNASPTDINGNPGPAEKSLMNEGGVWVESLDEPIEVTRVTHSYDFCIACAVHLITPNGEVKKIPIPALP